MKQNLKLFVVRKYVFAESAAQAIKHERKAPVHDVWIDDEWKRGQVDNLGKSMGFEHKK